ncbi:glycosyltransferase family 4 protein [Thermotoga profunda]|uniref:glycosyltransferase family 4 protein n=1 Tax=Thermotoga profunda TaxID=1508420 RepID=UPI0005970D05|nr:glycosyltransferase family 4 protein [Thermotoga profunda]
MRKRMLLISGIVGPVTGSNQSFRNTVIGYLNSDWQIVHLCFFSRKNRRYQLEDLLGFKNYRFRGIPLILEKLAVLVKTISKIGLKKQRKENFQLDASHQTFRRERFLNEVRSLNLIFFIVYSLFETVRGILIAAFFKPDIVYAYEVYSVIPALFISKLFRIPFVKRFQGVYAAHEYELKSYRYFPFKIAYSVASDLAIITNDGTGGNKLLTQLGFPRNRIIFLLNGIDERVLSFECKNVLRDDVLKRHSLPTDSKILTTFNRAYPAKRVDRAVYLLKSLRDKGIPVFLIWAGANGPLEEQIIEYSKMLNVHNFLRYLGPIPYEEVLKLLCISDLNLILNDEANLGNQILEAAWLGVPTLATDDGTNSRIIATPNIVYVKPEEFEIQGPIKAIEILEKNISERHVRPTTLYSWKRRMEVEIKLIEKLLSRGRARMK